MLYPENIKLFHKTPTVEVLLNGGSYLAGLSPYIGFRVPGQKTIFVLKTITKKRFKEMIANPDNFKKAINMILGKQ